MVVQFVTKLLSSLVLASNGQQVMINYILNWAGLCK